MGKHHFFLLFFFKISCDLKKGQRPWTQCERIKLHRDDHKADFQTAFEEMPTLRFLFRQQIQQLFWKNNDAPITWRIMFIILCEHMLIGYEVWTWQTCLVLIEYVSLLSFNWTCTALWVSGALLTEGFSALEMYLLFWLLLFLLSRLLRLSFPRQLPYSIARLYNFFCSPSPTSSFGSDQSAPLACRTSLSNKPQYIAHPKVDVAGWMSSKFWLA